ncbi:hypothetical protein [Streptosporangium canum]|uniref:hypothetical protein n=1 Tax=Streptosporangium canum TaxID=324952 RepID=UPI0037A62591
MLKPLALPAVALIAALLLPGTADALTSPIQSVPALTDNSLYRSGKIKSSECPDGALSIESAPAAKRTITALWRCLNTSWSAHFKHAKLPFAPAKLVVLTEPAPFCGKEWKQGFLSTYCAGTKTAAVLVNDEYYLRTREIYHFTYITALYGAHLQHTTGIARGFGALPYKNKAENFERERRWMLQGSCLSGVFLGSVWKTAGEGSEGWPALLDLVKSNGDYRSKKDRYFAKGKNIVYWLDRGFKSGDPGSCNTWKASSARVA